MSWSHRGVIGILIGGVALLAQTNVPPAEPKASAVSQIEEAAKKHASQRGSSAPMEILTDTMGVDFRPYLSRVLHNVRQNWCSHIPESAGFTKGWVTIDFYIMKDGAVRTRGTDQVGYAIYRVIRSVAVALTRIGHPRKMSVSSAGC